MKLKLSAVIVTSLLLSSCGGSGGDTGEIVETPVVDVNPSEPRDNNENNPLPPTNAILSENRSRPSGQFSSSTAGLKSNGTNLFSDDGDPPQRVSPARPASWPGLRYGDFLVLNNPWNASLAGFPFWFQEISLYENNGGYGVTFDWDWGAEGDTINGSVFSTKSFPEVVYGTKSASERSGTFAETGLPVEHFDAPFFSIEYDFNFQGRRSDSATASGTDSEFNVVIESFYHDSCDIRRTGNRDPDDNIPDDNQIMEVMVWLKHDQRLPSGPGDLLPFAFTSSDGRVFDIYKKSSVEGYIAYVARDQNNSGTVLYSEMLNDAKDNAGIYGVYQIKDTDCLANILTGTEIWHGGGTFNLDHLQVNRSY